LDFAVENYPFNDLNVAGLGFKNNDDETIDLGQVQKSEFLIKAKQTLERQQQLSGDQPLTETQIERTLKTVALSTQATSGELGLGQGITGDENAINKILNSGNVIVNAGDETQQNRPDISISEELNDTDSSENLSFNETSSVNSINGRAGNVSLDGNQKLNGQDIEIVDVENKKIIKEGGDENDILSNEPAAFFEQFSQDFQKTRDKKKIKENSKTENLSPLGYQRGPDGKFYVFTKDGIKQITLNINNDGFIPKDSASMSSLLESTKSINSMDSTGTISAALSGFGFGNSKGRYSKEFARIEQKMALVFDKLQRTEKEDFSIERKLKIIPFFFDNVKRTDLLSGDKFFAGEIPIEQNSEYRFKKIGVVSKTRYDKLKNQLLSFGLPDDDDTVRRGLAAQSIDIESGLLGFFNFEILKFQKPITEQEGRRVRISVAPKKNLGNLLKAEKILNRMF